MAGRGVYLGLGLSIGVIAALVVALVLSQQLSSTRARLGECENTLHKVTLERDNATRQLTECRKDLELAESRLAAANKTIADLRGELERARREAELLSANLSSLQARLEQLQANYTRLLSNYTRLKTRYERLSASYTTLKVEYEKLKANYSQLFGNYTQLKAMYSQLQGEYAGLKAEYEDLQARMQELQEKYWRISQEYEKLKSDYKELQEKYGNLVSNYASLQQKYSRLRGEYEELQAEMERLEEQYNQLAEAIQRAALWYGYLAPGVEEFYDTLLSQSVELVKRLVDLAGFTGDAGSRSFDVFTRTLLWLNYCPDDYARIVYPGNHTVIVHDEIIMLPNETWKLGCGDCEDLALFSYAILKATQRHGEHIFIVGFYYENNTGHVGVLVVRDTGTEKRYYIVDPAGNYFNGLSLYIMFRVIAPNGTRWRLYFSPLELWYGTKSDFSGLYTLVYYDYFEDKEYTYGNVSIWYYTDAFTALRDWIVKYWEAYDIAKIVLHDIGVHKEFSSITDAARWLEQNT